MLFFATEPALYFQPVWCCSAAAFLVLLFRFLTFKLLFHWLAARSCFPEPSPSLLPRKAFDSLWVQSRAHVLSLLTYICTVQRFRAGHAASLPPSFPWVPTECLGLGSSAGWAGDGLCGNNSLCHVQWCVQQGGETVPWVTSCFGRTTWHEKDNNALHWDVRFSQCDWVIVQYLFICAIRQHKRDWEMAFKIGKIWQQQVMFLQISSKPVLPESTNGRSSSFYISIFPLPFISS